MKGAFRWRRRSQSTPRKNGCCLTWSREDMRRSLWAIKLWARRQRDRGTIVSFFKTRQNATKTLKPLAHQVIADQPSSLRLKIKSSGRS